MQKIDTLYSQIRLDKQLERDIFERAMIGFFHLRQNQSLKDTSQITIIDYRKASNEKRFFVIDLAEKKVRIPLMWLMVKEVVFNLLRISRIFPDR